MSIVKICQQRHGGAPYEKNEIFRPTLSPDRDIGRVAGMSKVCHIPISFPRKYSKAFGKLSKITEGTYFLSFRDGGEGYWNIPKVTENVANYWFVKGVKLETKDDGVEIKLLHGSLNFRKCPEIVKKMVSLLTKLTKTNPALWHDACFVPESTRQPRNRQKWLEHNPSGVRHRTYSY